jgi:endopeptidase Clp ATP-binding regulatory subunit ClpX
MQNIIFTSITRRGELTMVYNHSGKDDDSIEERFKEMFKNIQFSFFMPPPATSSTQRKEGKEQKEADERVLKTIRNFNLKPRDIKAWLDRFVVKQDEAKKVLAVTVCDHYNHVRHCIENPDAVKEEEYHKHNVLLLGPTGVGKTYLIRCIARLIGVPFVKADATKFSETGYVGRDAEDLVRDLVKVANGNIELAQYGIIYLDEIDKIASAPSTTGRDVSGRGVQVNLLKLMEETEVSLFSQTDLIGQVQAILDMQRTGDTTKRSINTRHILFIVSGAFDSLAEIVRRRIGTAKIGFSSQDTRPQRDTDYLKLAETRDFIEFGFEPEFIARLPVRVVCEPLEVEDLEQIILNSEGSILKQYQRDFAGYSIDFKITPDAVRAIAEKAYQEKTGARALMTVFERLFRDFKFHLPSTSIKSFEVTKETVNSPQTVLEHLLSLETSPRVQAERILSQFAQNFEKEYGLNIVFSSGAITKLIELSQTENKSLQDICNERFRNFGYGFKLISRNTGKTRFTITTKLVENGEQELGKMVAESLRKKENQAS